MKLKENKFIFDLAEARKIKTGWTYILLSKDKKYMKIGKTVSNLESRIININNDTNYRQYDFKFHMAIRGAKYENELLKLFSEYRARYFWTYGKERSEPLTSKEVSKKLKSNTLETDKDRLVIFRDYVQSTRLELFKIPPRKVAPHIRELVLTSIK
ncbi:hypothetical protein [Vibrio vulnificus]|uniref:hypothetical protein n=1 Tax=Vibrio vulnificus TaxID=672 RepID=UPI00313452FB